MAFDAGSIFSKLSLDTSGFEKSVNEAEREFVDFTKVGTKRFEFFGRSIRSVSRLATASFKGLIGGLRRVQSAISSLYRSVFSLRNIFIGLGVGLATRQLIATASDVQRVEVAFSNLSKTIGADSSEAFSRLKAAAAGTVDDFSLLQSANQALLLGVATSVEQFELLIEAGRRLGQATGRTAREGFEDLATGIGRQSKLILDNLGLIVGVEQANIKYARALGVTTSELDDNQKKIAFQTAAYDAIQEKLAQLGPEQETLSLQVARFTSSLRNLFQEVARNVTPSLQDLFSAIEGLNKQSGDRSFAEILADGIRSFIDSTTRLIEDVGPKLLELLKDLADRAAQFVVVLGKAFDFFFTSFANAFDQGRLSEFFTNLSLTFLTIFGELGKIAGIQFLNGLKEGLSEEKELVARVLGGPLFGGIFADFAESGPTSVKGNVDAIRTSLVDFAKAVPKSKPSIDKLKELLVEFDKFVAGEGAANASSFSAVGPDEVQARLKREAEARRQFFSVPPESFYESLERDRAIANDAALRALSPDFGPSAEQSAQTIIDELYGKNEEAAEEVAEGIKKDWGKLFTDLAQSFGSDLQSSIQSAFSAFQSFFGEGSTFGGYLGAIGTGVNTALNLANQLGGGSSSSVSNIPVEELATSQSAVRGVVAGPQSVAIGEVGSSIREANRGVESLLRDILDAIRNGNTGLTSGGLGAAGTV